MNESVLNIKNLNKNRQEIEKILEEEDKVKGNLKQLKRYTIRYIKNLIKKHKEQYPRLTKINEKGFKEVEVRKLTATELSIKLDKKNGYIGTDIRNGEELFKCSSRDKLIVVWSDGGYKMIPPPDKFFVDKNWIHCEIFNKKTEFTTVYREPDFGIIYIKRFAFGGAIQNKNYKLAPDKSKILLFEEGVPDQIFVKYKPAKGQKIHQQVFNPNDVLKKRVTARGVQMTTKAISRIVTKQPSWWDKTKRGSKGILT